jgi:ADP-heptose:LPS heptosyltransferase
MKPLLFRALFFPFRKKGPLPLPENPGRVLVIRQDNRIGNLILITPFLSLIKKRWPGARLDVVAGGFFGEVISNNPEIDCLLIYNQLAFIRMPWKFPLFILKLRRNRYDMVFDLKAVFSFNNMMMTVLSGAAFRAGFKNFLSNAFFHYEAELPPPETYEAEYLAAIFRRFLDFGALPPIQYLPKDKWVEEAKSWLEGKGLPHQGLIGIHTGGRGNKKLDITLLLGLGRKLKADGRDLLFFCGPDEKGDKALVEKEGFACALPESVNAFGGFLPYLKLFISGDTGPMHMAAGAGIATVSFFTTTALDRFGPRGPRNSNFQVDGKSDLHPLVIKALAHEKQR